MSSPPSWDVDERAVLLTAEDVGIVDAARYGGPRKAYHRSRGCLSLTGCESLSLKSLIKLLRRSFATLGRNSALMRLAALHPKPAPPLGSYRRVNPLSLPKASPPSPTSQFRS